MQKIEIVEQNITKKKLGVNEIIERLGYSDFNHEKPIPLTSIVKVKKYNDEIYTICVTGMIISKIDKQNSGIRYTGKVIASDKTNIPLSRSSIDMTFFSREIVDVAYNPKVGDIFKDDAP